MEYRFYTYVTGFEFYNPGIKPKPAKGKKSKMLFIIYTASVFLFALAYHMCFHGSFYPVKACYFLSDFYFAISFSIPEIESCLEDAIHTFIGSDVVELWESRKMCSVAQKDIQFLKAYDGYVEAYVGGRVMRKDVSLNKMEEDLDKRLFFRVSRECVVNMAAIEDYRQGVIYIRNYEIKAARRRRREFEAAYLEFDITYGG